MNLSDSDISVARSRKYTTPFKPPPLQQPSASSVTESSLQGNELTASTRKLMKGLRKDPYLQPERQTLKPPFDFATKSRGFSSLDLLTKSMVANYGESPQSRKGHSIIRRPHTEPKTEPVSLSLSFRSMNPMLIM